MAVFAQAPQQTITAAVTPVVMISANAILISAVSSKHDSMSGRLRSLMGEYRREETTVARKNQIRAQVHLFRQRLTRVAMAHILLYAAAALFIAMVLVIALTPLLQTWSTVSLPLLVSGVTMMLIAIVLELVELRGSHKTIQLEISDLT